jgi:hypothetical protein
MFAILALLSSPAFAGSSPWMWGVGPTLSAVVFPSFIPGSYPLALPQNKDNADLSPRDNLEKADGVYGIGGRGVLYLKNRHRLGARLKLDLGEGFRSTGLTFEYDQSFFREGQVNMFIGGGFGFATLRFPQGDAGSLETNELRIRGQVSGTYRYTRGKPNKADDIGFDAAIFATLGLHGPEKYTLGDQTVEDDDEFSFSLEDDGEGKLTGALYNPTIGLEVTVFFGDFTPP